MFLPLNILSNLIIRSIPQVVLALNGTEIKPELIFNSYGCHGLVISNDRPVKLFQTIEAAIRLTDDRFNFRRYLFLPTEHLDEDLLGVFKTKCINFVADVLAVVVDNYTISYGFSKEDDFVFTLYTHKYVGYNDTNQVMLLDKWFSKNESFLHNKNLYPDKLDDQHGRPLKVATFTYKPYSVADPPDGTEVLVALEYARKHNMTPELVIDEVAEWGEVFDNWTGHGIIGNVAIDKSDIGLGALYTWEHDYQFLDLSKPMSRTGITCITLAPSLLGGWMSPFLSLPWTLWVATGVSFVFCSISIFSVTSFNLQYTLKNGRNVDGQESMVQAFFFTEAMFLLQSLPKTPKNQYARVIYCLTFLLCLMLASIYGSGLASNMTVPRYHGTIRTAQDLAESNIKWGATSTAWISSIMNETRPTYIKLLENFFYATEDILEPLNDHAFGFAVERLPGGHFAIGSYITMEGIQKRRLMNEDIYWEHCVIMARKSSILLPSIDILILQLAQTGISKSWEFQVVVRNLDRKMQEAVKYSTHLTSRSSEPVKLAWTHVEGAFGILAIGLGFSLISFSAELLLFKKKMRDKKKHPTEENINKLL